MENENEAKIEPSFATSNRSRVRVYVSVRVYVFSVFFRSLFSMEFFVAFIPTITRLIHSLALSLRSIGSRLVKTGPSARGSWNETKTRVKGNKWKLGGPTTIRTNRTKVKREEPWTNCLSSYTSINSSILHPLYRFAYPPFSLSLFLSLFFLFCVFIRLLHLVLRRNREMSKPLSSEFLSFLIISFIFILFRSLHVKGILYNMSIPLIIFSKL